MIASAPTTPHSTAKDRALPGAWAGREQAAKNFSRFSGRSRRKVPLLLLGILLIAACAAGGVLAGAHLGDREDVLVLAHPVAVGQILTLQDLKQVSLSADSTLELVHASAMSTIIGQPAAFSMPAGSLVTRSVLGATRIPARGQAMAAVGLKPGQFPPDLTLGTTVAVLAAAPQTTGASSGQAPSWTAVVAAIADREAEQTTVLTLQLPEPDARALASAPAGQLSVVSISGGGR
ncbi:SAF domain-containing protein [Umezawaea sp. NPDC059074]|uniref:SAF domain-containing protein n=1 Tax=Umezawaea sp. NPDC059074 TaxID=3346716 RepID=UPI0036879D92